MNTSSDDIGVALVLPQILNLGVAETLREEFVSTIAPQSNLSIEAGNVDTITTPCLQVLIAAGLFVEEGGGKVCITNPSASFTQSFQDLGLNDIFEKWSS